MALENDLDQRSLPISEVSIEATEFVLKLQLLRCGPILQYKTEKNEGVRQPLIFVDEEGTKIQTTLFGEYTEKWKGSLEASKVFYVINGRIRRPKLTYNNVNTLKELSVTQFTEIRSCTSTFETVQFSNGFYEPDHAKHMDPKMLYDVAGILVETSGLKETAGSKRRVVVITNESYDRVEVTLWGDHAVHDGLHLENAENLNSVVAFCNLKVTEFKGCQGFSSTAVTSVLLNPTFKRAEELLLWNKDMLERNVDITLVPSKQIRHATEMNIPQILESQNDNPKNIYCKFNATIKEVLRKDILCYRSCKKCNKKVDIDNGRIYCERCSSSHQEFSYRYFLRLLLEFDKIKPKEISETSGLTADSKMQEEENANNQSEKDKLQKIAPNVVLDDDDTIGGHGKAVYQDNTITVKLFEGAKFLIGCNANDYMASISEKAEVSQYYQRIVSSEGQKYTFMVKNYHTIPEHNRTTEMVIEEMHLLGTAGVQDQQQRPSSSALGKRQLMAGHEVNVNTEQPAKKTKGSMKK